MDPRNRAEHTLHRYDEELEEVRARVMRIGGLVEQQLADALGALAQVDGERAARVVRGDRQINEQELEVDECCTSLLARRAPVAGDLRLVIGVIKAVSDLERMGDEAVRIARMAMRTAERGVGAGSRVGDLRHMGPRVQSMLSNALDAFARTDPEAAVNVMQEDRGVDREYDSLSREMITFMMEDPRAIPLGLDVMFAARALERIGDRACNLCEYVIYIVKGTDVRHAPIEIVRNTARGE
jgi:phosphate transport system protein